MAQATKQKFADRHNGAMQPATFEPALDTSKLKYDYEQIAPEHRQTVIEAAVRIKASTDRLRESILETGTRLLAVKDFLPHGQFSEWIRTEFDLSLRMAQNMMNVAREFGGKSETVSLLSDSVLYVLAAPSTPAEAREAILRRAEETGVSPSRTEAQQTIAQFRGEVEVIEPDPAYATLGELQIAVSDWTRREFWRLDSQIEELAAIVEGRQKHRRPDLVKQLTPANGIAAYRTEDLDRAIAAVLEARRRQKATIDAQPAPPPPKPPLPDTWTLSRAIQAWLEPKALDAKQQHALLSEIAEQGEAHPEYEAMVAKFPDRWRKTELKRALADRMDTISWHFGDDEWETYQLPSGRWYARNKARHPISTAAYETADDALLHRYDANTQHTHFYESLKRILTDPVEGYWFVGILEKPTPDQMRELLTGLEQRAAEPDAPAYIASRLERVQGRLAEARRLLEVAGDLPTVTQTVAATCRVCGCTDDHACEGGCWWVEPDLCSACVSKMDEAQAMDEVAAETEEEDGLRPAKANSERAERDAAREPYERTPLEAAIEAAKRALSFDEWLAAMPEITEPRQRLAIVELAKRQIQDARKDDADLNGVATNVLPPLSQFIVRLEKKVKQ